MASLIRRSIVNISKTPGTGITSIVPSTTGLTIPTTPSAPSTPGPLDAVKASYFAAGGNVVTNLKLPVIRDPQVYIPTEAQKRVLRPENVIGSDYITVEKVTGDYQTGQINVQYSTNTPKVAQTPASTGPIVKTVTSASQAATLSKYVGRTLKVGEGLTAADIRRINTPGAGLPQTGPSAGFTGGQGYGQLFPINEAEFKLAQQAVMISRVKSLAIKSGFTVATAAGVKKQISFNQVTPGKTTLPFFPTTIIRK